MTAIATAPQNVMRQAPLTIGAQPTRADVAPRAARKASDATETHRLS